MLQECVFCKIICGDIKSKIIKENEHVLVINDITPKAPIHYLILPKKHIENMACISEVDKDTCWAMCDMVKELSKELPDGSFNLISNNGRTAGQSVPHLHWHCLSGKNIYAGGFLL